MLKIILPLVKPVGGLRRVTVDRVGCGELLVRDVAAPVLGVDRRVDQRTDRCRGEREAQLRPCEARDVDAQVTVGPALPLLHREEETRGGRVLAHRRNGRPNNPHVFCEKRDQRRAEHHGLQSKRPSSLERRRGRIP